MSLSALALMIRDTYGWRIRPTDVKLAARRIDGSVYFRLADGRNGVVA